MTGRIPESQPLPIVVRAYVCKAKSSMTQTKNVKKTSHKKIAGPSEWTLIFDTETTTNASQKLRFGSYQVRKSGDLMESGIFYDPETIKKSEQKTLEAYVEAHGLKLLTAKEFIESVLYLIGYKYRATIVGFNLPFDISRLAIDHAPARTNPFNKIMRGGFTFKLSENPFHPRVQIKHISSRDSFIQFAAIGQLTSRGNRKKGRYVPARRGYFIDLKTLAAALTSKSHSLESLGTSLNVTAQKHKTSDHGNALTPDYIDYAVRDTQTTWECFVKLQKLFDLHCLKQTPAHDIHSEASLGKAYLKEMGIEPWRKMQPDFLPEIMGHIMSAYYGGRSEVHIRREIVQVLYCDFLSMYPTVCTLMGLWRFVTAKGMAWQDATEKTRDFLEKVTLQDLQAQDIWRSLCTVVQVAPDKDIFPIRAKYDGDSQYTIGLNYLTSEKPLWYTLADCIAAKLLTGSAPKILQAISFEPGKIQEGLKPVNIAGDADYRVDPCQGDFFRRIIDLRSAVKNQLKIAPDAEKSALDNQQLALKILANSTSYGIFVELNPEEEKQLQDLLCYGPGGKAIPIQKKKFEAPGKFFHPLLSALITGAARLMLAVTENLAQDAGLDWAFCDTDSMALAKPDGMDCEEFYSRAQQVQEWFTLLNPYTDKTPLLKIEDCNFSKLDEKTLEPLYCHAVSSKRYALFNIKNEQPVLRKASAHGLGHLIAPYERPDQADLEDLKPWQRDLWLEIIEAGMENRQPDFSKLENFDMPAKSRYGATTPALEKWFAAYNKNKPYKDRVRPFNFMLAMQVKASLKSLKPVSPYHKIPSKAAYTCFDRVTGQKIRKGQLKTYREALAQYHLHPETKFLNGDYLDKGKTQRRHIRAQLIQPIGKEANKWEEQFFTGFDPQAQIEYGGCPDQRNEMAEKVFQAVEKYGAADIAEISKISVRHISGLCGKKKIVSDQTLFRLYATVKILDQKCEDERLSKDKIREMMTAKNISLRRLAKELDIDPSNLSKMLSGRRDCQLEWGKVYICMENILFSKNCNFP